MKFNTNWNLVAAIIPVVMVLVGWGISIEVRMSQRFNIENLEKKINLIETAAQQEEIATSNQINAFTNEVKGMNRRMQNIEELLTPVLVDYRVRKELEKQSMYTVPVPAPPIPPAPSPSPAPALAKPEPKKASRGIEPPIESAPAASLVDQKAIEQEVAAEIQKGQIVR